MNSFNFFRFEVCPASDVYFGYQQIHTIKTLTVDLKNVGKFPFAFSLASPYSDQEKASIFEKKKLVPKKTRESRSSIFERKSIVSKWSSEQPSSTTIRSKR